MQTNPAVTPLTHHVPNAQLVELIPLSAQTVVEIGCGSGATGALYLRRNPRARYVGLEITESYAALARTHLTECHVGNIETLDILQLTGGVAPDCIVFGDVLEHLQDPWALLKKLKLQLAPHGCIAACVPNTGHWSVLANLLGGQWPYADTGLFDRTHLRFFTRQSLIALFQSAGLAVTDVRQRQKMPPSNAAVLPALLQAAASMGVQNPQLETELNTFQWLIRAAAAPVRPLLVHAKLHRPLGGMSDVRMELPLKALATEPGVRLASMGVNLPSPKAQANADNLFIWQRPLSTPQSRGAVAQFAQAGVASIIEFDDEPSLWPENVADEQRLFAAAAGTQTSTAPLQKRFGDLGANVGVFANGVYELPADPLPMPRGENGAVQLFFGALNRKDDWAPLMGALNEVLASTAVPFHVQVVHDEDFFKALQTPHKTFTPLCDYAAFHAILRRCDMAWLPLTDNHKNRCKSDLKFIESAAHGVAVLASPVVYAASVQPGVTGLLYDSSAAFKMQLTALLGDPALRTALGLAARQYVAQHRMLAYDNARRLAWYRDRVVRGACTQNAAP